MNTVTGAQLRLAHWLLEQGPTPEDSRAVANAAVHVWDKLSPRLAGIFTIAGSQGLAKRAIFIAQRDFPLLRGAEAEPGLNGLRAAMAAADESEAARAAGAVLAKIIALCMTFIGEALTLRAIRDVWPEAPFGEADQPRQEASS